MPNMLRGSRSTRNQDTCPYGCCVKYRKAYGRKHRIESMYRSREKRQWKKEVEDVPM